MLALYVLGVASASAVAAWSAVVVGREKRRERSPAARAPRLFLVSASEGAAIDRALHSEIHRRARGGRPRRQMG